MKIGGALTALVTPFKNGKVDEEAYRQFIEWQIEQGINGLVPCGTTGESATLSHAEHETVIRICVEQARGRVPVVAGAGSNNTQEAISLAKFAKAAGANAILLITPYYNKPTQEGLVAHFKAVAREVSIPTVVYNVPGRTCVNVLPNTMARLYNEIPEVIGCKEATGNLTQVAEILELVDDKFIMLSGDDFTLLPLLSVGGHGVISVASNLVPRMYADLCASFAKGDLETAQKIHYTLLPLCRACFVETNPAPIKAAVSLLGKMDIELRLPMVTPQASTLEVMKVAMRGLGLL